MGAICSTANADADSANAAGTSRPERRSNTQPEVVPNKPQNGAVTSGDDQSFETSLNHNGADNPVNIFSMDSTALQTSLSNIFSTDTVFEHISAFKTAMMEDDDQAVMYLCEKEDMLDPSTIRFAEDKNNTSLMIAVEKKNMTIIVYLLNYGVNVNSVNSDGDSALHICARQQDVRLAVLLCDAGADTKLKNAVDESPIDIAYKLFDKDMIELLSPEAQLEIGMTIRAQNSELMLSGIDYVLAGGGTDNNLPDQIPNATSISPAQSLSTPTSPNSKLKRLVSPVILEIIDDFVAVETQKDVVQVCGWIEKKSSSFPYSWKKRWVQINDQYMLWGQFKVQCENVHVRKLRNNFKHLNLLQVAEVKKHSNKRCFVIITGISGKQKDRAQTIWRCENEEDIEYWIKNLKLHVVKAKDKVSYLRNKKSR